MDIAIRVSAKRDTVFNPKHHTECPACHITWEGDEIPVGLHRLNPGYYPTMEDAIRGAAAYGWTPENKRKFGINVLGVEIPSEYDGIGYWKCLKCGVVVDRFTGEIKCP